MTDIAAVLPAAADTAAPVAVVGVPAAELAGVTGELMMAGARLADMFAANTAAANTGAANMGAANTGAANTGAANTAAAGTDPVTLRMVWALDEHRQYLITESEITGSEYPALSDIAPAAFLEECEIYEQFGLRPAGGKPLNRVAVPPQPDIDLPRLGRAPAEPPREVHAPHAVGGHAFEFPFGPVRQVGVESLYYGLVTSGEEVVDLYLFTWHKHRGVEWRAQGRTPEEALFNIERLEGLGAVANGWAFAAAAESALGLEPDAVALRCRAIALELERLYNHAAAIAALCQACGLSVGRAAAEIALEQLLRLNAAAFGHRYLFGVLTVGGVQRFPDTAALQAGLPAAYAELRRAGEALLRTNSFVDRLEATGIVTHAEAVRLGLVGPVARASGVGSDVRADHPSGPYGSYPVTAVTQRSGDVLARFNVMLAEAAVSVELITALLAETGPDGRSVANGREPGLVAGRSGLGWAESSRGESLAWVALDEAGRITRARLRPAAVRNWRGFDDACRAQNVFTDIPIIEASFWLTVAGTAR
jgi:Ni,Fe-hydrogenase III large subunit